MTRSRTPIARRKANARASPGTIPYCRDEKAGASRAPAPIAISASAASAVTVSAVIG
jgi:hypothetical protein